MRRCVAERCVFSPGDLLRRGTIKHGIAYFLILRRNQQVPRPASSSASSRAPARGERAAIAGYEPQYRASAGLVLRALQRRDLEWIRVADLSAGRVDDLQLATPGRLDAYQFKFGTWPGTLTLHKLLKPEGNAPPLLRSLADGWQERRKAFPDRNVVVFLATDHIASRHDQVTKHGGEGGEKHFAAFLSQAWLPVSTGGCSIESTNGRWGDTWKQIALVANLGEADLGHFVRQCRLEFGLRLEPGVEVLGRERDVWDRAISDIQTLMMQAVGGPRREVEYSAEKLINLLGLTTELHGVHRHEFRLDEHSYEPLLETEEKLSAALGRGSGGYIAITGTPGSGKSSLLTRFLRSGRSERIVRYYAFTPDELSPGRGEAVNFLSDMVGELERQGVRNTGSVPHHFDIEILRQRWQDQLRALGDEYATSGRCTILLVDGLDHIAREQNPDRSLIDELPPPDQVPEGIYILLGTQTPQAIPPRVAQPIREAKWRQIEMTPLPPAGVRQVLRRCGLDARLDEVQILSVIDVTDGHPLALGYLLAQLDAATTKEEINRVLESAPAFRGHIEASYRSHWIALGNAQAPVAELLGHLARLRHPFDLTWVRTWADRRALEILTKQFFHYFRRNDEVWEFFHQSFRLFVEHESTTIGFGENDLSAHRAIHREIARHCGDTPENSIWHKEQLYHLAEAGDDAAVTALATREWFLSAFDRFASRSSIFADYWLAHRSAARALQGLKVLQLALVKHELETRFDALELEDEVVLRVLLTSDRALALSRLSAAKGLHVSASSALHAAKSLLDAGEDREARRIFLQIRPVHEPRGQFGENTPAVQAESLVQWALVARFFLRLPEVIRTFQKHHFEHGEPLGIQPTEERPPLDQERCRAHALVRLAITLLSEGSTACSAECVEAVPWQNVSQEMRREFLLARATAAQAVGETDTALQDLCEARALPLPTHSEGTVLRTAELAFLCGAENDARDLLKQIPQPAARSLGAGRSDTRADPLFGFRWLRLSEALQMAPVLAEWLPVDEPSSEGTVLMIRVRAMVAQIWAAAWRDEDVERAELSRRIANVLRLLHQSPPNTLQWSGIRDIHEIAWQATQLLPSACAAFGEPGLRVLEDVIGEAWANSYNRRYWLPANSRALIEQMLKEGASSVWAAHWLEDVERDFEIATNAGERVSECTAQAEAWLAAGQPDRAAAILRKALHLSFGIGYHKDYQLSVLLPMLQEHWRRNPSDAWKQCALIARSLHALRHETHGGGMWDAAERLIETAFANSPSLGFKTWEYISSHGPCSFVNSLAAMLRAALDEVRPDIEIIAEITGSLLVPLDENGSSELIEKVFWVALRNHDRERVGRWAQRFQQQVLTRGFPRARREWLSGLVEAGICSDAILQDFPEEGSDSSVRATSEIVDRLRHSEQPFAAFRGVLREERAQGDGEPRLHRFIGWPQIALSVIPRLDILEIQDALELLGEPGRAPAVVLSAVKTLLELGERNMACSLALRSVEREIAGVGHFRDSASLTCAHEALSLAAPDVAKSQWFSSLECHDWLDARQWATASAILLDSEEQITFSGDVSRYVTALLDGCDADTPMFAAFQDADTRNAGDVLADTLLQLAEHPSGIVRHGAQGACLVLLECGNVSTRECVRLSLEQRHPYRAIILSILIAAARTDPDTVRSFWPEVSALADDPGIDVRLAVEELRRVLEMPVAKSRAEFVPLDPAYRILLPIAESGIAVGLYSHQMELVARRTGLPLAALLQRLDRIHLQILAEEAGPASQRPLPERLRDAGLEFRFRTDGARAAERALMRMLAELYDAGLFEDDELSLTVKMFSIRDTNFIGASPEIRPSSFGLCKSEPKIEPWSEEWLSSIILPNLSDLGRINPGWRLLGAEHVFNVLTDYRPIEHHWLLVSGTSAPTFASDKGPFVRAGVFSSEDYLHALVKADGLVMSPLSPQDLPCRPWLAFVPNVARFLGWQPSTESWFSWTNHSGRLVARSIWWLDGPTAYFGRAFSQVAGEGWAVIVSDEGWAEISERCGPLRLDHWIERRHDAAENNLKPKEKFHQHLPSEA